MSRQYGFFALKEDLVPVIDKFEGGGVVKYARKGLHSREPCETFGHAKDIPTLGKATCETAGGSDTFLIFGQDTPIKLRAVKLVGGQQHLILDQLLNPDTITFTPGGIWNERILLCGRVGTASNAKLSQQLLNRFHSALKKTFRKIKTFYVGPRAEELLSQGVRLTMAEQSPQEFDLTK